MITTQFHDCLTTSRPLKQRTSFARQERPSMRWSSAASFPASSASVAACRFAKRTAVTGSARSPRCRWKGKSDERVALDRIPAAFGRSMCGIDYQTAVSAPGTAAGAIDVQIGGPAVGRGARAAFAASRALATGNEARCPPLNNSHRVGWIGYARSESSQTVRDCGEGNHPQGSPGAATSGDKETRRDHDGNMCNG